MTKRTRTAPSGGIDPHHLFRVGEADGIFVAHRANRGSMADRKSGTVEDGGISDHHHFLCRRHRRLEMVWDLLPTSGDVGYKYVTVFDGY